MLALRIVYPYIYTSTCSQNLRKVLHDFLELKETTACGALTLIGRELFTNHVPLLDTIE